MENSHFSPLELSASAPTFSSLSSSPTPSFSRRLSLQSFRGSTPIRKRSQAPSSYIHSEASPSTTLSNPSRQDHIIFSSQPRPEPRETSFTLGRISIVATPRSKAPRPASIISTNSTKSSYDRSRNLWSQQSVLKRISWGWNQTFAGLTPEQLTEFEIKRARAIQYDFPKRIPIERRLSSANSETSTTSPISRVSSESTTPSEPTVNKPFANRRPSAVRTIRPEVELPPVEEEEAIEEEAIEEEEEEEEESLLDSAQDQEFDDMGLRRAFSTRFMRSNSPAVQKQRPQISLPALISTTNAQLNDSLDIHPALRTSGSSNDYPLSFGTTTPTTPISEDTPGLTDSSSVGSSRSSSNGSPTMDRSPTAERFSTATVEPNHLTQYFPQLAPEKVADNVTILTDDVVSTAPPALPKRAPSHSKREHERLARTRSMRSSGSLSRTSEPTGRALTAPSSRHVSLETKDQPFASELAQVAEVHEDFHSLVLEEQRTNDEVLMSGAGYRAITPSVYMMDLADMEAGRWD